MAYKEGTTSVALFWIPKYRSYRLRILRYKWGYIFTKYYYIPQPFSVAFHDGSKRQRSLIILALIAIVYIFLLIVFSLLQSLLVAAHIL